MLKSLTALCLVSVIASGCATKRVALEGLGASRADEVIIKEIAYDDKGLPVIGAALVKRPCRPGDHFSLVRRDKGKPVVSYDIAVRRQKPDFVKPLRVVYEWTGKGFMLGANITGALLRGFPEVAPGNLEAAAIELAIIVTPLAAGTAGGFVIGLADGVRQTALELSKVVVNGEVVITYTIYGYDALNRLASLRMFTADGKQELVRTEFAYEGTSTTPSRAVVKSLVEGKERDIR